MTKYNYHSNLMPKVDEIMSAYRFCSKYNINVQHKSELEVVNLVRNLLGKPKFQTPAKIFDVGEAESVCLDNRINTTGMTTFEILDKANDCSYNPHSFYPMMRDAEAICREKYHLDTSNMSATEMFANAMKKPVTDDIAGYIHAKFCREHGVNVKGMSDPALARRAWRITHKDEIIAHQKKVIGREYRAKYRAKQQAKGHAEFVKGVKNGTYDLDGYTIDKDADAQLCTDNNISPAMLDDHDVHLVAQRLRGRDRDMVDDSNDDVSPATSYCSEYGAETDSMKDSEIINLDHKLHGEGAPYEDVRPMDVSEAKAIYSYHGYYPEAGMSDIEIIQEAQKMKDDEDFNEGWPL